ncbi:MAG TPA: ATP-binding cassette domain-containing protein [Alphaproteobacteria bacterium]|nr:ATP-binding cassette domain-containing protein [Alphaproteobacteria bacterium]HNS43873.1 ATP-binding cassette domain-containing protein [Alphaproteobacteria bacterium]
MTDDRSSYLIHARDVRYRYGEGDISQYVLKGADLSVRSGEFVILAGPSGSGKSTFLSLIGALRKGQEGYIEVASHDLLNCHEHEMRDIRRKIGFVFQQHNLLNFLTASQNVEMVLEMFNGRFDEQHRKEKAREVLEKVGLGKQVDYYPRQLSVGQKQRVAIARSLVHQPKIILADEPTASLDGKTGVQVVEMLHHMVKTQGCGALVVTHDNRIFDYADRILHIEDGVIMAG